MNPKPEEEKGPTPPYPLSEIKTGFKTTIPEGFIHPHLRHPDEKPQVPYDISEISSKTKTIRPDDYPFSPTPIDFFAWKRWLYERKLTYRQFRKSNPNPRTILRRLGYLAIPYKLFSLQQRAFTDENNY